MLFSLALDVFLAVLLIVTICYAMVLNRKLSRFRNEKMELEKLAKLFGEAMERAGDSIGKLKNTAGGLQDRIDKAQALRDDLVFLIDRGGSAADRLEEMVREARNEGGFGPRPVPEYHLGAESPPQNKEKKTKSGIDKENNAPKLRSEAERELLKALQAAR